MFQTPAENLLNFANNDTQEISSFLLSQLGASERLSLFVEQWLFETLCSLFPINRRYNIGPSDIIYLYLF